jgi:hypothetical protein
MPKWYALWERKNLPLNSSIVGNIFKARAISEGMPPFSHAF